MSYLTENFLRSALIKQLRGISSTILPGWQVRSMYQPELLRPVQKSIYIAILSVSRVGWQSSRNLKDQGQWKEQVKFLAEVSWSLLAIDSLNPSKQGDSEYTAHDALELVNTHVHAPTYLAALQKSGLYLYPPQGIVSRTFQGASGTWQVTPSIILRGAITQSLFKDIDSTNIITDTLIEEI